MSVHDLLVSPEMLAQSGFSGLTAGRFWSLVGVAVGSAGLVIGARTLIRRAGRRSAVAASVAGLIGSVIGVLVVAAADGGPGTGHGIIGGFLALAIGLAAAALSVVALRRSPRTR
ncbi:DUF6223 family protein [Nocardia sp. NPDC003963]